MSRLIDLTGQRYGRLVVLRRSPKSGTNKGVYWLCRCDCGKEKYIRGANLRNGTIRSCGCYQKEMESEWNKTHGMSSTKLYKIWKNMKARCYNPRVDRYPHYGGRGISVCKEWHMFIPFRDWAFSSGYKEGLSIDRIDVNGNYSPCNCRWVTMKEQALNKTTNHLIAYHGITRSITEWAKAFGITYGTMHDRLKSGWSMEKISSTPLLSGKRL